MIDSPWLRQPNEPPRAHRAFMFYCNLGPARSMRKAYQAYLAAGGAVLQKGYKPATSAAGENGRRVDSPPGQWVQWSRRYSWVARALSFDDANTGIVDDARRRVADETAEAWERRREEQRERDYQNGEQMQRLAAELVEGEMESVTPSSVARMAITGSKLARLATGMPTDHTNVQVTPAPAGSDLSGLSDAELNGRLLQLANDALTLASVSTSAEAETNQP